MISFVIRIELLKLIPEIEEWITIGKISLSNYFRFIFSRKVSLLTKESTFTIPAELEIRLFMLSVSSTVSGIFILSIGPEYCPLVRRSSISKIVCIKAAVL
jgi:hypothetical protein